TGSYGRTTLSTGFTCGCSTMLKSGPRRKVDLSLLHRHRHHHRRRIVQPFDKLDLANFLFSSGKDGQISDLLLALQKKGEPGTGNIHAANVVGEMDSIHEPMVFDFAVLVVQPNDHGHRPFPAQRETPTAYPAQQMDGPGGAVAKDLDRFGHFGRELALA